MSGSGVGTALKELSFLSVLTVQEVFLISKLNQKQWYRLPMNLTQELSLG